MSDAILLGYPSIRRPVPSSKCRPGMDLGLNLLSAAAGEFSLALLLNIEKVHQIS